MMLHCRFQEGDVNGENEAKTISKGDILRHIVAYCKFQEAIDK